MNTESDDTKDSQHYCVLDYLYRDAANWKTWGKVLLRGAVTVADLARIESKLEAGEFFIPEQIGFESLTTTLFSAAAGTSKMITYGTSSRPFELPLLRKLLNFRFGVLPKTCLQ